MANGEEQAAETKLAKLCDDDPVAALAAIEALPDTQKNSFETAGLKLTALHHRALRSLKVALPLVLFHVPDGELAERLTEHSRDYALAARDAALALVRRDAARALGPGDLAITIDSALCLGERLEPGSVQEGAGWTRLRYFGTSRLGSIGTLAAPGTALNAMLGARLSAPVTLRAAVITGVLQGTDGQWTAELTATHHPYRRFTRIGEAGILGSLLLSEMGATTFTPVEEEEVQGDAVELQPQKGPWSKALGGLLALSVAAFTYAVLWNAGWLPFNRDTVTEYTTRPANVRAEPTATSSLKGTRKRGDPVTGSWIRRSPNVQWLKLTTGGYISSLSLSPDKRPVIVRELDRDMKVEIATTMLAIPAATGRFEQTLKPGWIVHVWAEVKGGWMEIQRRVGGVGYARADAFVPSAPRDAAPRREVEFIKQNGAKLCTAPTASSCGDGFFLRSDKLSGEWIGPKGPQGWFHLLAGSFKGRYVQGTYLASESPPEGDSVDRDLYVEQEGPIRAAPRDEAPVLETATGGQNVHITMRINGDWYEVLTSKGNVGYLRSSAFRRS